MSELWGAIDTGSLPSFAYVKFRTSENEHPGYGYVSDGESNVAEIVDRIAGSKSSGDTLVLLTWDEGGGFYDHVPPPQSVEVFPPGWTNEGQPVPYGTRVPLLAIGPFAKAHHKSHVLMEHSSIVKFLEWNFLGPRHVGDIARSWPGARDGDPRVNNLGSMLDSAAVGLFVPQ
jgi:phospholipase C